MGFLLSTLALVLILVFYSLSLSIPFGSNFGLPTVNATYDYVIVGGGTAGLAIASRLSEDLSLQIAVVEAGSFYEITTGNTSQLPADDVYWTGKNPQDSNPLIDWGFTTTPQKGLNGEITHYTRGKTLGGCSALNYLAYDIPSCGALQRWADLVNDSSYEYDNFSPFFRKTMNFTAPDNTKRAANSTPKYNIADLRTGGPLGLGYSNYAQAYSTWIEESMQGLGIQPTDAFVDGSLNGSAWTVQTRDGTTGLRESSETSFLRAALGRSNFIIYTQTMAQQVLFEGTSATGVLVSSGGAEYVLSASKEVILSAGAFQSPQLLQVSGVGPKDVLNQYGIPVVVDAPGVGQNLQDQIYYGIGYRVNVYTASALRYPVGKAEAIKAFNTEQSGLLSNNGGDFVAYEKMPSFLQDTLSNKTLSELSSYPVDWPDLEYLVVPAFIGDLDFPGMESPLDGYQYATLAVSFMKPSSRGNLSISSASMSRQPLINPAWLTTQTDQEVAVAAFKRARQILETPVMSRVNIGPEYYPGANVSTDAQILHQIKTSFNTIFHASSTCKMGTAEDNMAVVDSRCRVLGTSNLRVVDVSAFPFLPPGLPLSVIYALAEKIAESIKQGDQ